MRWPGWWQWEIVVSSHAEERMIDRGFSETDLRTMLEDATGLSPDHEPDRWAVSTSRGRELWEIIVEPDPLQRILKVVTAYRVG